MGIYVAGNQVGKYVRHLHSKVLDKVKYGLGNPETRTVAIWQLPGRGAHAGQTLTIKHKNNKNIQTLETAFKSSQSNSPYQPYLRETISEDKFTKEKMAGVMFVKPNGTIERLTGKPDTPEIIKFVKNVFGDCNKDGKSLILHRY